MAYSTRIKNLVAKTPDCLGKQLGETCIKTEIPVQVLAKWMGVSRQGCYYWITGVTEIAENKRKKVEQIIRVLDAAYNEKALPANDLETALDVVRQFKTNLTETA